MHWIDAHAHLSQFSRLEMTNLLEKASSQKLEFWILAGYDSQDWIKQIQLANERPNSVKTCFGIHPWVVNKLSSTAAEQELLILESQLHLAHALGETGMDKLKGADSLSLQKVVFIRHLELNQKWNLPLVIHSVHSDDDVLEELKKYQYSGIVHRFSGSYETAKRYLDLGYKISLSRNMASSGYLKLKECVQKLDLDDFVIESDAGLTPEGKAEDACDLFFKTVKVIAELKNVSHSTLLKSSFENTKKVFRL